MRSVALWAISRGAAVALRPSRSTVVLGRAGCAGVAPCGSSDVEPHDGAPAADPEQRRCYVACPNSCAGSRVTPYECRLDARPRRTAKSDPLECVVSRDKLRARGQGTFDSFKKRMVSVPRR